MSPTAEARRQRDILIYLRVTLIVLAFSFVVIAGTYYYVQRTSDRLDSARARGDQQFSKALLVIDRKFRQSLRVTTQQFAYAQNKQVCAFRQKTIPELQSYRDAAKDTESSASSRERNAARVLEDEQFLNSLVTIPAGFDCDSLPKNPPRPEAP